MSEKNLETKSTMWQDTESTYQKNQQLSVYYQQTYRKGDHGNIPIQIVQRK